MNHRTLLLSLIVLVAAMSAASFLQAGEQERRMAAAMRGQWDMTRDPHRACVYMVIRQPDNMYPSFWVGTNHAGTVDIEAREDFLTGEVAVKQEGAFAVQITRAARKQGMADKIPGGVWANELGEGHFVVHFDRFTGWQWDGVYSGKEDRGIKTTASFRGRMVVGDKQTAIRGDASLRFSEMIPQFSLHARFSFEGKALGLTGSQSGPMHVDLYTKSIASTKKSAPTIDERLEPEGPSLP